jgi:hypothetical protein
MQSGMSPLDTGADVRAERRSATLCTLGAAAFVGLTLCVSGAASSETLLGSTVQLHEGEVVPSSVLALSNESETLRISRSTVGGLAPGHSTGPSGLQLESRMVTVPEPSSALQGVAAVLTLLAWRRGRVRS